MLLPPPFAGTAEFSANSIGSHRTVQEPGVERV
jgi:hypothetical protein